MRIKITGGGIYDGEGNEIPVGTEIDVADHDADPPHPWAGRFENISGSKKGKTPATGDGALKAEHHGGGKFNITQGETVLLSGITKTEADEFNALSPEDKAAFVAQAPKD